MTAKELFKYLTDDVGLDEATTAAIMKAAENEKVSTKASSLKQQSEFAEIERRAQALQADLDGKDGKLGAKAYQEWYTKNYPEIQKLQTKAALYEERYGALDVTNAPAKPAAAATTQFSAEDVQRIVNETIQTNYAPKWDSLVRGGMTITEKHIRAGRKNNLDIAKIAELAQAKGGDLVAAYDEWDKPEADAAAKADEEKRINKAVEERIAQRQTSSFFPAGADATPSNGSPLTRGRGATSEPKYDRNKVIESAVTGKYEGILPVQ